MWKTRPRLRWGIDTRLGLTCNITLFTHYHFYMVIFPNNKPNEMREQVTSITIGLFLAFVSALADHAFNLNMTRSDNLFLGLLSYIISLLTFWGFRLQALGEVKEIGNKLTQIGAQLGIGENIGNAHRGVADSYWNLCVIRASHGVFSLVEPNQLSINHPQRRLFWLQAILNTELSWDCTCNPVIPKSIDQTFLLDGFRYQSIVSRINGVPVKRVFIVHEEQHLEVMIKHASWQASLGFNIKIYKRFAQEDPKCIVSIQKLLGTIDLAIMDGRYLIAFHLTGDMYEMNTLVFYKEQKLVDEVREAYRHLFDIGETVPEHDIED